MRCDNGAVVISLPKAFTSPGLDFTSPRVVFTSPGLVFTSPGLVFASRRVVKPSLGSSQCKSRMCEGKPEFCEDKAENLWRQVNEMCGSLPGCPMMGSRAYIYTYIMFGKSIHPFTGCSFYIDFHQFCVWRLAPWSIHASVSCCEHFTPLPFTPETTENQRETSILWRREHFFR